MAGASGVFYDVRGALEKVSPLFFFSLPSILLKYGDRSYIVISHVTPSGIHTIIGLLVLSFEVGQEMDPPMLVAMIAFKSVS